MAIPKENFQGRIAYVKAPPTPEVDWAQVKILSKEPHFPIKADNSTDVTKGYVFVEDSSQDIVIHLASDLQMHNDG